MRKIHKVDPQLMEFHVHAPRGLTTNLIENPEAKGGKQLKKLVNLRNQR